ncbi:hypothetical protein NX059_012190 [Plenodomus lindquistii]|nr:hypothetical protein NX059_012190 [Plenodomus lindquistii]
MGCCRLDDPDLSLARQRLKGNDEAGEEEEEGEDNNDQEEEDEEEDQEKEEDEHYNHTALDNSPELEPPLPEAACQSPLYAQRSP